MTGWRQHFYKHGFSHEKADFHMALLCAQVWNANHFVPKSPLSHTDFLPKQQCQKPPPVERTEEELMSLATAAGGIYLECPDS
ncbi:phage tail assembly protein T [Photobacterium sp. MCCC 1A19761]|uniref:phage tail assembly protein T n=1 Tax=Photobacterium sp. MCCC 1A19761 TaxID=3115000 RepID=UPI003FCD01D7